MKESQKMNEAIDKIATALEQKNYIDSSKIWGKEILAEFFKAVVYDPGRERPEGPLLSENMSFEVFPKLGKDPVTFQINFVINHERETIEPNNLKVNIMGKGEKVYPGLTLDKLPNAKEVYESLQQEVNENTKKKPRRFRNDSRKNGHSKGL